MFAYVRLKSLMFAYFEKKYFSPELWSLIVRTQWVGGCRKWSAGVLEYWGGEAGGNEHKVGSKPQLELSSVGWADIITGMFPTQNLRVTEVVRLSPPRALKAELPMTEAANATVVRGRQCIQAMLEQKDPRLLVVVGPCSIHDADGAMEYAGKLNVLRKEFADQMEIVMRVYFEKPRTTVGWKGLINDPHLDNTHDIEAGLKKARRLLLDITGMGLPAATEFLDPIIPQYISDLISWAAIGARTTESQTHREMASGLSMPVGFKNATDGSLQIAIDAMGAAMRPHSFLGIDQDGFTSIVRTTGNPVGHVVLRGGRLRTNYDADSIRDAETKLGQAGLPAVMMVDCSHANSAKQHARQEDVWRSVIEQRTAGTRSLMGIMVESYLNEGSQPFPKNPAELRYGVSISDACLGWEATERMLRWGHATLSKARLPEASAV
jgi:3-deoxy-7-phosphoheptulonate synthase